MKIAGIILLFLCAKAHAAPFLVSDPYPSGLSQFLTPTSFNLTGLGPAVNSPALVNADGTVVLHYDLSGLGNGTFTVTASAVNQFGGISPASAPFSFGIGTPSAPTNLRISPQ